MCHPTGNLLFTRTLWLRASLSPPSSQNKPQSFCLILWVDAQKSWVATPKQVCDRRARHLLECNALLWKRHWWQMNQCGLHWSLLSGLLKDRRLLNVLLFLDGSNSLGMLPGLYAPPPESWSRKIFDVYVIYSNLYLVILEMQWDWDNWLLKCDMTQPSFSFKRGRPWVRVQEAVLGNRWIKTLPFCSRADRPPPHPGPCSPQGRLFPSYLFM